MAVRLLLRALVLDEDRGAPPVTHPLMEYLPPVQQQRGPQPPQASGAEKYHGPIAEGYDAKRESSPKWICEQRLIEGMLSDLPAGSVILDCPVGTGRFLDFYVSKGLRFVGADISGDMLVQSALKVMPQHQVEAWVAASNQRNTILPLRIKDKDSLIIGDVRQIGLEAKSVDAAVMCRLTRWLSPEDCKVAMRELQRVCRQRIVWTARVANHQHARSRALFEQALNGWRIVHDEAGYITDYRILCAQPE
jgi:ubiquinone/menaquinone biosynthesis C-methylase UbiE